MFHVKHWNVNVLDTQLKHLYNTHLLAIFPQFLFFCYVSRETLFNWLTNYINKISNYNLKKFVIFFYPHFIIKLMFHVKH